MIAALTLDSSGSDKGQLRPMSERLAVAYGQRPGEHPVDGGFAKLADIEALAAAGIVVFAPVPKPRDAARDPYAPREGDRPGVAAWRRRMGGEAAKAVTHFPQLPGQGRCDGWEQVNDNAGRYDSYAGWRGGRRRLGGHAVRVAAAMAPDRVAGSGGRVGRDIARRRRGA